MAGSQQEAVLEKEVNVAAAAASPQSNPEMRESKLHENLIEKPEIVIDRDVIEKDFGTGGGIFEKETDGIGYLSPEISHTGHKRESVESQYQPTIDSDLDTTDVSHDRPSHSRATSVSAGARSLPSLRRPETKLAQKEAHPWQHLGITLGLPMILLFDIVVPCIIYYSWYNDQRGLWLNRCHQQFPDQPCPLPAPEFDKDILGYAIVSFGFGELWILIARIWRLWFRREECAPLLSRYRWELDATCWVYAVALLMGLIPFVVGSSLVIPKLYLYSPSFIMVFLGILMFITTMCPFKIPIGINSHARGSGLRPFIYYAAEDFVAVDGLQDREFRVRYNERYESNKMFRAFFFNLTLWWMLGVCTYVGCVSAVIWTLEFHIAFGLSLGVLFSYIAIWAGVTVLWVNVEMKREHRAYENGEVES